MRLRLVLGQITVLDVGVMPRPEQYPERFVLVEQDGEPEVHVLDSDAVPFGFAGVRGEIEQEDDDEYADPDDD